MENGHVSDYVYKYRHVGSRRNDKLEGYTIEDFILLVVG